MTVFGVSRCAKLVKYWIEFLIFVFFVFDRSWIPGRDLKEIGFPHTSEILEVVAEFLPYTPTYILRIVVHEQRFQRNRLSAVKAA